MSLSMDRKGVFRNQVARKTNGLWLTELEPCDLFHFYGKLFFTTIFNKKNFFLSLMLCHLNIFFIQNILIHLLSSYGSCHKVINLISEECYISLRYMLFLLIKLKHIICTLIFINYHHNKFRELQVV